MNQLLVEYEGRTWVFEFVEIGGSALATKTQNIERQFESQIVLEIKSGLLDLQVLYLLLVNLTKQRFHGWIVAMDSQPKLTSWEVKKTEENKIICKVGYKVWMPENEINYQAKGLNND